MIPVAAKVLPENSLSNAPISNCDPNGIGRCVPRKSIAGALYFSLATVVNSEVAALSSRELSPRSNSPLSKSTNPTEPVILPVFTAKLNRLEQSLQ